ncbi:MAG: ABC transporter permease [Clostridiales bacterium]|nr:ABC transporter permease [Clostridiales bacterium]
MKTLKRIYGSFYSRSTILAFLILTAVSSIAFADRNFLSITNIVNILTKAAKNGGFLALGMTFVILLGHIDLSAGSVFALSGVVMALIGQTNPFLGIFAGLMVGVVSGFLTGFMVAKMKISSWIASLSMMFALRGMVSIVAHSSVAVDNEILRFASAKFFKGFLGVTTGFSVLIPILFALVFICMYVSKYTAFGMEIYAVGGNSEAARMMGINVDKIIMKAFICSGVIASLSGVLLASNSGSATLSAGNTYETYAIAMCAIGSVKLSGGEGRFSGTFFGMMIYFVINTIFTYLNGVSVHWQSVIMGVLVLISVIVQSEVLRDLKINRKNVTIQNPPY